MRTKLIYFVLCMLLSALPMSGCGNNNTMSADADLGKSASDVKEKELTVVTSFYPVYLHTINVAKDIPGVRVVNMTAAQTGCLHDYNLTANDMKTLEAAQVFVVNGAGMEAFIDKVIKQMPKLKIVSASEGIEFMKNDTEHEHHEEEEDTDHDHEHGEDNPHVWVSISNAIVQVRNIAKQLSEIDPAHAKEYQNNADSYIKKLEEQKKKMHAALDGLPNRDIITFHEAFPYFAKEFGLNILAVIEREPGSESSAKELAQTIEIVKESGTTALFAEPQYVEKAARTIARETGARLYYLDPVVTGEANGDYDAYLKAMDKNLEVLKEALK